MDGAASDGNQRTCIELIAVPHYQFVPEREYIIEISEYGNRLVEACDLANCFVDI
jgi:hypothetical protein